MSLNAEIVEQMSSAMTRIVFDSNWGQRGISCPNSNVSEIDSFSPFDLSRGFRPTTRVLHEKTYAKTSEDRCAGLRPPCNATWSPRNRCLSRRRRPNRVHATVARAGVSHRVLVWVYTLMTNHIHTIVVPGSDSGLAKTFVTLIRSMATSSIRSMAFRDTCGRRASIPPCSMKPIFGRLSDTSNETRSARAW
jgi:hypothetical protein